MYSWIFHQGLLPVLHEQDINSSFTKVGKYAPNKLSCGEKRLGGRLINLHYYGDRVQVSVGIGSIPPALYTCPPPDIEVRQNSFSNFLPFGIYGVGPRSTGK